MSELPAHTLDLATLRWFEPSQVSKLCLTTEGLPVLIDQRHPLWPVVVDADTAEWTPPPVEEAIADLMPEAERENAMIDTIAARVAALLRAAS